MIVCKKQPLPAEDTIWAVVGETETEYLLERRLWRESEPVRVKKDEWIVLAP